MAGPVSLIFSIIVVILIVIGVLDVIKENQDNRCYMTYMFERPEYMKVPMKRDVTKRFPNYGLYVYGEGNYARMLVDMKMTGIPVLFIPGNAGSYKQVRSLGSVAFRKAIDMQKHYHFNFFSVDLADEFSGIYGPVLQDQVEYVHCAMKKIFSLYKKASVKPKTIVLVGHSMGGLIARALFTLPDFDHTTVNTIFMQATPNQAPVIVLDPTLAEFYREVNKYWRDHENTTLNHVTLVSTGGGDKDIQVREGLTPLDGIVDETSGISMSTTHIPKAWVPADHRCIVWCKQVVLAFVRSLFEIVDEGKKQIRDDKEYRMSVFRHHFLHHPGTHGHTREWKREITLSKTIKWEIKPEKLWKWEKDAVTKKQYLAMPVAEGEDDIDNVVIVSNILSDSWVCACELKQGEQQCSQCIDLSSKGYMIPPLNSYKKTVHIDLNQPELESVTHIVIMVPTANDKTEITAEMYGQANNHLLNTFPGIFEIILAYPESVTTGAMTLDLGAVSFYRLKLHGLSNVVKVYTAFLDAYKCTEKKSDEHSGSLLHFHVPWSNEDTFEHIPYNKSGNLTLKLQHAPPPPVVFDPNNMDMMFAPQYDHVELLIHLDPSCQYQVRVKASMREMVQQFVRFYALLMPPFCVATLLITLVHQLRTLQKDGVCPSVLESIWQIKPFNVVPFVLILQVILQLKVVQPYLSKFHLPLPDSLEIDSRGIGFRGLPFVLYTLALGVTTFQALVITAVIQFNSRLLGLMFGWLPNAISFLVKLAAILLCVAAVIVAGFVCGSVGIFVPYIICFAQVLRLCYLSRQTEEKQAKSKYNFYMLIFMLWMWLLILNSPPLLVWGKTISETRVVDVLYSDPSRVIGFVAADVFIFLLCTDSPVSGRRTARSVALVIYVLTILMLVFSTVMLYRVTYVILLSLSILALSIFFGSFETKGVVKPKTD